MGFQQTFNTRLKAHPQIADTHNHKKALLIGVKFYALNEYFKKLNFFHVV